MSRDSYDAVVVGAGPNGLSAAVTLAEAGRSVLVVEAADTIGGGTRSAELTLPGFVHDVCSAIHPLGAGSPYLSRLPLERHGLRWLQPELPLAHPLDGGRAAVLRRSVEETAAGLGDDAASYRRWIGGVAERWDELAPMVTGPLVRVPRHPLVLTRFGLPALAPASRAGRMWFDTDEGRALFAGCAAHAFLPLDHLLTSSFGLVLMAAAHAVGWPVAEGGSQCIATALAAHLTELGGEIRTGEIVRSMDQLPAARAVLFDLAPRQVAAIAGDRLPARFRDRLLDYKHGPAAFKVDYALSGPVPWTNEECLRAGTVHVGGTAEEIAASEADSANDRHPERPYMLVAQQSLLDPTRAPAGKHTLWTYCHVPNGSTVDMTERMEAQLERFAPGFKDLVLARHVAGPSWFESYNPAYVGGDIAGGSHGGLQLVLRQTFRLQAYRTPDPSIFLCSASTPPGAGVHGMCGHHAANAALRGVLA
jgi:phytoene dehydrogenase-like protein